MVGTGGGTSTAARPPPAPRSWPPPGAPTSSTSSSSEPIVVCTPQRGSRASPMAGTVGGGWVRTFAHSGTHSRGTRPRRHEDHSGGGGRHREAPFGIRRTTRSGRVPRSGCGANSSGTVSGELGIGRHRPCGPTMWQNCDRSRPDCRGGQAAYQANGWGRAGPTDWKTCHRQGTSGTATASLSTSHSAPQGQPASPAGIDVDRTHDSSTSGRIPTPPGHCFGT